MTGRRFLIAAALAGAAVAAASLADAADWPAYRGPRGNGTSSETGLLKTWPDGGPPVLWRVPLGEGYSGISAVAGRLFTMYSNDDAEVIAAFDASTGKEMWRVRVDDSRRDDQGGGPRSTPTVDGGLVYGLGARGKLVAVRVEDGVEVWRRDLPAEFDARVPRWGVSTSPLVEGDLLLVDAGGGSGKSIVALDKKTGEERWTSYADQPGYATPLAITLGGVRQVLFFTGTSLASLAPESGRVLWSVPWKTSYDVNAAMPVFVPPEKVFVSSGYDVGAAVFQVEMQGSKGIAKQVWRSQVMKNHFNSSILYGGHLYGFDYGTLKCIDAHTGEEAWKERGFQKGSLLLADGHLFVFSEDGLLALVEATPEAYREKSRAQILEGRTWTMPSLADGTLFLRNRSEMVALKVRE